MLRTCMRIMLLVPVNNKYNPYISTEQCDATNVYKNECHSQTPGTHIQRSNSGSFVARKTFWVYNAFCSLSLIVFRADKHLTSADKHLKSGSLHAHKYSGSYTIQPHIFWELGLHLYMHTQTYRKLHYTCALRQLHYTCTLRQLHYTCTLRQLHYTCTRGQMHYTCALKGSCTTHAHRPKFWELHYTCAPTKILEAALYISTFRELHYTCAPTNI